MLELGKPIRARVLKVEPGRAILGVYVEGMWRRISARVHNVDLQEKEWIRGILNRQDNSTYLFTEIERDET